jgi:hypothetical protein
MDDIVNRWMKSDKVDSIDGLYMPYIVSAVGNPVKFFFINGVVYAKNIENAVTTEEEHKKMIERDSDDEKEKEKEKEKEELSRDLSKNEMRLFNKNKELITHKIKMDEFIFAIYANEENLSKSCPRLMKDGKCNLMLRASGWIYASNPDESKLHCSYDVLDLRLRAKLIPITLAAYNELVRQKCKILDEQMYLPTKPLYNSLYE